MKEKINIFIWYSSVEKKGPKCIHAWPTAVRPDQKEEDRRIIPKPVLFEGVRNIGLTYFFLRRTKKIY